MAYQAPVWENGGSPAISAENLNAMSQALEGAQVLYGNSAPTSATKGAVGQYYLVVMSNSQGDYPLYQCVGISGGSYVWKLFEYTSKYISASVAQLLGLSQGATVDDALFVLGSPTAGKGVLRVSCVDVYGRPVSGCIVQVGSTWGSSTKVGAVTFDLNSGTHSVSIRSPIDYGLGTQTKSVTILPGESVTLSVTIEDSLSGAQEFRVTGSVAMAAFSDRVTSADAFCVGGGGSGAAARRYPSGSNRSLAAGGAGGYTKMKTNINLDLPIVLTVGAGGSAVAAANSQNIGANGNSGGTTKIVDMLGTTIISASGGSGGQYTNGSYLTGANGGSGSGGVSEINALYVGASGQDGANGAQAGNSNAPGGTGQGTTTRLWGSSSGELFCSAGASAIASNDHSGAIAGTPGSGGGTAYAENYINVTGDLRAGDATTYGSGGGALAAIDDESSGSYYSGAGKQGLIVFRWEVSA